MGWHRRIIAVLACIVVVAGGLAFAPAASRVDNRVEAAGQAENAALRLGDRFGFVGDAQLDSAPDNPYYLYEIGNQRDPVNHIRLAAHQNGAPSDTESPENLTNVPDHSYWLIGNEPNATGASPHASPEAYADLTHRWYVGLKAINPTAQVFVGQTAYTDNAYLDQWWRAYNDKYGPPPFDGYTIHVYTLPWDPYMAEAVPVNVDRMREWMKAKGVGDKPLWLTEYGVNMGRDKNGEIEWDRIRNYMRKTNGWLIANTDKVQRWFWFAVTTHDGANCWTGDLYNILVNPACENGTTDDGSPTVLGDEYMTEISQLNASAPQSYLPLVMKNAYDGWNTTIHLRNNGASSGLVTVMYYDLNGRSVSSEMQVVPAGGTWAVSQSDDVYLADGYAGSAVISSPQPVVATVNQLPASGDGMSYNGERTGANRVYLPVALNNAYGGWTSGINVMNVGDGPAQVNITYYDAAGRAVGSGDRNGSLRANQAWPVYQGNGQLPVGFAGSAIVTSNQPVVAVVNEVLYGNSTGGATSYNGQPDAGTSVYFPAVMNNAYGGWTTGIGLKNVGSGEAQVNIDYYDNTGGVVGSERKAVPAGGYWGVYQGGGQLPDGFAGSAQVRSNQPIVGIVNETNGKTAQAMSYEGLSHGSTEVYLPVMLNGTPSGWTTGIGIKNLGSRANITIDYYAADGHLQRTQTEAVGADGFWGAYQGAAGLPAGFVGSAVIRSGQPLVAVVNQISSSGSSLSYNAIAER